MKNRRFLKVISIVLALGLLGGAAYALYGKSVPSHIEIEQAPATPGIALEFYQNEAATQLLTFVEWGKLYQGDTRTMIILYVKNVGNTNATITGASSLPASTGTLEIKFKKGATYISNASLDVGEVIEAKGYLSVATNASVGHVNFSITISAR